ncbi:MAG TPA: hypothetical protein VK760_16780 [Candidatus Acidoferrales bacterium]|jgi:hypothetical protein|nr:hypothetical protein [Candidatus Acidoferrales bacterium]
MHHNVELWGRVWMGAFMALVGVTQLIFPDRYCSANTFFRRGFGRLTPEQSGRLSRVLDARRDAEGVLLSPTRYTGLLGIAMAALEFVPAIPFIIPYAVYCLFAALTFLASYLHVRQATERRTAPLVRRSPLDALPPVLLGAFGGCFLGVLAVVAIQPHRVGSIAVAASMLIFAWIAWRIAGSQAVMFGEDPQLEYAVDERLRVSRASGTVALACAPAVVLVGWSVIAVPENVKYIGNVAEIVTYVSFAVAILMCATVVRRFPVRFGNGTVG